MAEFKGAASEGGRALQLMKRRQKQQEEMLLRKRKIEEDLKIGRIDKKFASHFDSIESELRSSTIGLVTLDEMKSKQESIIKEREKQVALLKLEEDKSNRDKAQRKLDKRRKQASALSFTFNDNEEENENFFHDVQDDENDFDYTGVDRMERRKYGKDPTIDTSFLPDKDREEEENKFRETLILQWKDKQEEIKHEKIEIVYSYWDGSGHRRQVTMQKGSSIQEFLFVVLENLKRDDLTAFPELKTATVDSLMYVKEDIIIPQYYTFYDFIVSKARGKSGPLFNFDVHDDVRLCGDAAIDKDESHAGKVVLRSWYDKNKHIFPASRWEPFDPTKKWDTYTIGDHIFK